MKIITETKAYVQLNDLAYLLRGCENMPIPASIFEKCFMEPLIVIDSNRYEFVEFTEPTAIEFFKKWSYSVDFIALQSFTDEELLKQINSINDKRNGIVRLYNAMTAESKADHYNLVNECEMLEFQMYSIRDILWFRQGHLKFKLPSDISSRIELPQKESGIKKYFKRFRKEKDKKCI